MTLPLHPDMLAVAYDYLAATKPFSSWNLPSSEDVIFRVVRHPQLRGWYMHENGRHVIGISARNIGTTDALMRVMAHEMAHLHQGDVKMETPGAQHNAAFMKLAEKICKAHGFDKRLF